MSEIGKYDKAKYKQLLEEVCEDYCPVGKYCICKEFLISSHPDRRLLIQLKCIDRYKIVKSKDAGKDIGWEETMKLWISSGCAKLFAELYTDEKSDKVLFNEIIKEEK